MILCVPSSLASSPRFANILLQLHSLSLSLGLSGVYRARFRISRFFSRNKGTRKNQHKRQLKEEKNGEEEKRLHVESYTWIHIL